MKSSSLAVVIPTSGRSQQLFECLASLDRNFIDSSRVRAIVVDNNSDEHLIRSVKNITRGFPRVQYVHCASPGLSSARHHALKCLDSDVICYVDDDVQFSASWLESMMQAFADNDVAIAGGPSIPDFQGSVPAWFWDFVSPTPYGGWCCTWLSLLDIGQDVANVNPNWIWGLNLAIRREVLLDCDGFHIDLVPKQFIRWQGDGETGLTMKLAAKGFKSVYRQDSLLFHHCGPERLNPDYFVRRAYYQGVCNSYTELRRKYRGELTHNNSVPQVNLFKRILLPPIRAFRTRLRNWPFSPKPVSLWAATAEEVRAKCQQAEHDGYRFHQQEASSDPSLREWIRRDNYFDVDLRDLTEK
jgi:GT2 family glycosyltransferase